MDGKNLRDARKKKNISQEKLAEILGVHQPTVGRWERGKNDPSDEKKKELSKLLNVSIAHLMGETEKHQYILRPMRTYVGLSLETASQLAGFSYDELDTMETEEGSVNDEIKTKLITMYGDYLSRHNKESHKNQAYRAALKKQSETDFEALLKMLAAEDPDLILQFRNISKNIDKVNIKDRKFLASLFKVALEKIEFEKT